MLEYVIARGVTIIQSILCLSVVSMHTSIRHHNCVEQIRITGWHRVCSVFDDQFEVSFTCLAWLGVLNRDVVHV